MAVRPSQLEDPVRQVGVMVLLHQCSDGLPRLGNAGDQVHPHRLVRLQSDDVSDADYGVEHRPLAVGQPRACIHCRR